MATLVDLLEVRADTPYIFLEDGEGDARSITAPELALRARRIAALLRRRARPGDRAVIVMPPGLDFIAAFFGCLYAGVIAVPAYPPHPRHATRLTAIIDACGATVLLVPRAFASIDPRCVAIEDAPDEEADATPGEIAMLQFTSGSTAAPRGVILTHDCIRANLDAIAQAFSLGDGQRVVSWLPPYHDMGLIGAILGPLAVGAQAIMMSPLHFLQRPDRWLRAITKYRAEFSGGPNFAYDLCTRKASPDGLDLSSWTTAFNGAEVVRASTMERFADKFACAGFQRSAFAPCYGLAEATLLATVRRGVRVVDGRVSCGPTAPGVALSIVDGEVRLAGASIARGYWGGAPFEGGWLRTGDLGFVDGGELFVTGRSKDLIIFAGRKLYPDDIEQVAAASHPALRPGCTAAFSVDAADREQLVIVQELDGEPDLAEVRGAITRAVVEAFDVAPHDVDLVGKGHVQKTSSGKVQRRACRDAYLASRREMSR